jgi:predicted nucleotidyltransferase component of viral defense system
MILQKEIAGLSEQYGVAKTVVDKDWVLGHFISGIYSDAELRGNLVFKGGTCLKKCWFSDYRFSEDLDFTSLSESFIFTDKHLKTICNHVRAYAGIQTHIVSLRPLLYQNKHVGYEAIVKYWGADHPKNEAPAPPERWQTKIKIEIILYEKLVFKSIDKRLHHPYSDELALKASVPCYAIEEVLAEKIRALIQRSYTAPRDYYDIWYLSTNITDLNWKIIVEGFYEKMRFKDLEFTGIGQLINPKSEKAVIAAWKNSFGHQIDRNKMPGYEEVKSSLTNLFNQIFNDPKSKNSH